MPRIKSILIRREIDQAKKAHNCQANARHRIECHDTRLNVRHGRSWDRYCVSCAKTIIDRDIAELQELQRNFQAFPDRNTSPT
jgi:hypothetical protein